MMSHLYDAFTMTHYYPIRIAEKFLTVTREYHLEKNLQQKMSFYLREHMIDSDDVRNI